MDAAKTVRGIFNGVNKYQLTVTRSGLSGSISTGDGKITGCTGTCTAADYAANASVTITATDGATDVFTGWAGACTGTVNPCVLSMGTADKGVTATFLPGASLTVATAASHGGLGTITTTDAKISCGADCSESYTVGTVVRVSANVGTNSIFKGWTSTPAGVCTANPCDLTLSEPTSLTATFEQPELTVIKAGAGSGTVTGDVGGAPEELNCGASCAHTFTLNDTVSLTATADSGSRFDAATGWTGDAACTTNPCTVSMTAAKSVTATFIKTWTVTVQVTGTGTVTDNFSHSCSSGSCPFVYDALADVTLTATTGGTFTGWGGGICTGTTPCSLVDLAADHTVTATFSP
ncbi:MAG: hypothetical protein QM765_48310 [Myxococcales bacterium]